MAEATSVFLLCASWALLHASADSPAVEKDVLEAVAEEVEERGVGRCGGGSVLLRPADDPSASVDWLFPNGWPPDFSVTSVINPTPASGTLMTLYDAYGVEHFQLRLVDGSVVLMYKPPSAPQLLLRFEAGILSSEWSIFGLSVKGDAATLIVNCREMSQPLLRPSNSTLPSDGIILLGQPLLENSTGFHEECPDRNNEELIAGVSRLNVPLRALMSKGQVRDVEKIHIHPRCIPLQKFDFAVAELEHFLYFSPYIRPIPEMSYDRMKNLPRVCSTAGWRESLPGWERPIRYYEDIVVTDYIVLEQAECPQVQEPQEGVHFVCTTVYPLWHYSFNGVWPEDLLSRNPGDHGSGLLCNGRVIAILSHHNKNRMYSMFTSLGPAMSFLSPFFQDFEDPSSNAPSSHPLLLLLIGLLSLAYQPLMFKAP